MAAPLVWTLCAAVMLSASTLQGEAAAKGNERKLVDDPGGLKHGAVLKKKTITDTTGHGNIRQETLDKLQHVLRLFKEVHKERDQSTAHKTVDAPSDPRDDEDWEPEPNGKREKTIGGPGAASTSKIDEDKVLDSVKMILGEKNIEAPDEDPSGSQSDMDRLLEEFAFLEVVRSRLSEDDNNAQEKKNIISSRGDVDLMTATRLVMQAMLQDCTRSTQNAIYDSGMYTAPNEQSILYNDILQELSSVYASLQTAGRQTDQSGLLSAVDSLERALGAEALTVIVIPKMGRQGSTQDGFQKPLLPQQDDQQAIVEEEVQKVQNAQLQGVLTKPESQVIQTAVQESPSAALTKVVQTVGDKAGQSLIDQLKTIKTIQKIQGDLTQSQVSKVLTGLQESPQEAMQVLQTVVQETTQKKTQATQQSKTVIQTLTSLGRLTTDDSDKITDALQKSPAKAVQTIIGVVGEKVDLSDTDRQRLVTVVQNNKDKLGSQDVASVVQAWQTSPQQAMSVITQTVGRKTGQTVSVHFTGSTQQVFQQPQQATFQQTAQQVQSVVQQAQLQGVLTQPESQAIQTAVQESPSAALTKVVQTVGDKAGKTPLDQLQTIQTIQKIQGDLTQSQVSKVLTGLQESPQKAMQVLQTVVQETTQKKTQATQQSKTVIQTLTSLGRLTTDDSDKITDAFKTSPADAIQTIIGVVGEKVDLSDTDRQRLVTVVQNNKDKLGSQDVASVVQAWQTSPQQAMSVITQTVGRKTGQTVSVHFTGSTQQVFQQPQQATFQQTAQQVQSVVQQAQLQGVLTQPESQAIQTAVQESPSAALTKVVQTVGDKAGKTPLDQLQTIQTIQKIQGDLTQSQVSKVLTGLQESPQKAMQVLQTVVQETTQKKTQATQQSKTVIQTLTSLGRLTTDDSDKITDAFKTSPADAIQTIIGVVGEKVDLSDTDRQRLVTVVQNNKDKLGSQDVASVVQAWQTSPQQAMSVITQTVGRKTGQTVSVHFTGSTQQVFQQPQQATFQQTAQQVQSVVQQAQLQGVLTQPESQAIQTAVQESPSAALTKVVQTVGDKAGKTPFDQLQTIQTIQKIQGDLTQSQVSKVLTGLQESPQNAMQVLQTVVQETTQKKTQATQQSKTVIQTLTSLGRLTTDDSDKITDAFKTSPADAIQTIIGVVGEKVDLSDTDRQRLVTVVQNNKDKLGSQDVASVVQAWQTSPQQAMSVITQTVGRKTGQTVSVHFTGSTQQVFQQPQQATFQQTAQQVQSVVQQAQLQGVLTQPESQAIQTAVQESPSAALTKVVQTVGDKAGKTPLDQLQTIQTIQKIQGDLTQSQVSKVLTGLQESPQKAMQVLQTVVQETTQKKTQATQQSKTVIQTLTSLGRLTTDDSDKITDAFKTSPADAIQTIIGVVGEKVDLSDTDRQRLVTVVQNNKDKLGSQDVASVVQAWQTSPQQAMSVITQTVGRKTGQTVSVHFTGSTQQVFQQPQQATFQQTAQQVQSVVQQAQLQGVLTQPESQAIQTAVQESPSAALTKVVQTVLQTVVQETTQKKTQATQQSKTVIQTLTSLGRLTTDNSDKITDAFKTSPADAIQTIIGVVGEKVDLSDTDRQRLVTVVQNNKDKLGSQDVASVVQAWQTSPQQAMSVITQTVGRKTGQTVSVHFTGSTQQVFQQPQQATFQQTAQQVQSVVQQAQLQGVLTQPESQAIQTAVQESPSAALTKVMQTVGDKAGKTPLDQLQTIQTIQKIQGDLTQSQVSKVLTGLQESPQKAMQVLQTVVQETTQKKTQATQQSKTVIQTLTSLGRLTTDDSDKITDAFKTSPADAIQTIIGVVGEKVDLSDTDRQRLVTVVQNNKDKLGSQDVASVVQAWQTSPQQAMSVITQTVGRKTGQTVSVHFTGSTQQVFQQPQQATFQQTAQQVQSVVQQAQLQGVLTQPESQAIQTAVQESPSAALTKVVQTVGDKAGKTPLDQLQTIQTIQKIQGDLTQSQVSKVLTGLQESPQKAMQVLQTVVQETTQKKTQATQQSKTVIQTLTSLGRLTTDDSDKITDAFKTSPADAIQTIIGVVGEKVDLSDTDRQRLVTVVQNNKDKLGSQDVASVVQAWQTSPQQAMSVITQTVGRKTGQTVSVHFTGSTQQVFQQPQQATFQQTAQQVQSVVQQAQLQGVLTQPESQAIQTAVQESPSAALTKVVQTVGDKAGKTPLDQLQTIQTIQKIQGDLTQSQVSKVLTGLQESPQKAMQVLQTVVQETTQKKTQATQQSKTVIQTLTSLGRLTTDDSDKITDAFKTSPADAIQTIIGVVGEKVDLSDTDRQRLVTVVQNNKDKLGSQDVASVVQAWQTSPQQAMSVITQTVGRKTGQTVSVHFTGSTQQVFQQPQQATFQQTAQQVQSVVQQAQLQGVLTQPESQAIQTAVQESPSAALTKVVQTVGDKAGKTPLDQLQTIQTIQKIQGDLTQSQVSKVLTGLQESPQKAMQVLQTVVQETTQKKTQATQQSKTVIQTLTSLGRLTTDDSDKITDAFKTSPADAIQTIIGVVGEKVDLSDTDRQRLVTVVQNNKDKLGSQDVASVVQAWQTSPQQAMSVITQTVGRKTGQTVSVHFTGSTQQVFQQPQQATFQQTAQQVQSVVQQAQLQGVLTQPESQAIQTAVQESPSAALTKVVQTVGDKAGKTPLDQLQTIQTIQKIQGDLTQSQTLTSLGRLTTDDSDKITDAFKTSPADAIQTIIGVVGEKVDLSDTDRQRLVTVVQNNKDKLGSQDVASVVQAWQTSPQQAMSVITQTVGRKTGQTVSVHFTGSTQQVFQQPQQATFQQTAQQVQSVVQQAQLQGVLTQPESQAIQTAVQESPSAALTKVVQTVGDKAGKTPLDQLQTIQTIQKIQGDLTQSQVSKVLTGLQESPQKAMQVLQTVVQETTQKKTQATQQSKTVIQTLTSLGRLTTDDSDKITDAFKTSPADAIQTIIGVVGEKVDLSDTDRQRLVTVVQNNKDKLGSQDVASVVQAWQTSPQQAMSVITQTVGRKTGQTVSVHFTGSTQQVFQQPQQATFQQTAQQVQSVVQQAQLQGVLTQPESQAIQTAVQESPSAALTKVVQTVGDKAGKTPLDQLQTIQTIQKIQGDLTQSQVSKVLTGLQESPQKAMQVLQTVVQETTQKKTQATQQSKTVIQTLTSLGRLTTDDSDKITDAFKTSPADAIQTIIGVVGEKVDLSDTDRQRLVTVVQNNKDKLGSQDVASVVQAWQTSPQQAMSVITQTVGRKTGQTVSVHFTGSTQQVFQQPQQATFQQTAQQVQSVVQQAQLQGVLTQPESQAIQTAVQESPSAALTKVVQTTTPDKITDAFKTSPADAIQTIIGVVGEKVDLSDTDRQRLVTVVQNNKDKLGSQDVASVVQAWQTSPQQAMSVITQTVGRKTGQTVSVHFTGSTQQVFQQPQQATFQQTAQQVQSVVQQAQLQGVLTQPESQAIQTAVQESPSAALTKVVQTVGDKAGKTPLDQLQTIQTIQKIQGDLTQNPDILGRLTTDDSDKITDAFKTSPADAIQTIIGVVGEKVDLSDTDRQRLVTVVQNNKDKLGSQDVASVVQAWQTSPQQAMSVITQTVGRKTGQTVSVHFTGSTQQVFQQPQQATFQQTAQQVQSVVQQAQLQGVLTQPESQAIQTAVQESTLGSFDKSCADVGDKAGKTPLDQLQTIQTIQKIQGDLTQSQVSKVLTGLQESPQKAMQTLTSLGRLTTDDSDKITDAFKTSPADAIQTIIGVVGEKVDLSDTDRQRLVTVVQNNKDKLGSQDVASVVQAWQTSPQQAMSVITQTVGRKTGQTVSVHFTGSTQQVFQQPQQATFQQTAQQVQSVVQQAQLQGVLTQPESQAIQTAVQESPSAALTKVVQTVGDKAGKRPLINCRQYRPFKRYKGTSLKVRSARS
ncbi:Hypp71 [Branchiostoma lanceolatum]|uniref:Hypp71 protein n=1 Tax=Branchiostoma lanceolatum TaxID=7740 RepID=A0A8J9YMZ6_BRALA|nr:Hypp71 [Branchiostoma lanceolatum]